MKMNRYNKKRLFASIFVLIIFFLSCENNSSKSKKEKIQKPLVKAKTQPLSRKKNSSILDQRMYLSVNKKKKGVVLLDNGLQYNIIKKGKGGSPKIFDTCYVFIKGELIDGAIFENNIGESKLKPIALSTVNTGLSIALRMMSVGAKWRIVMPEDLGYGDFGYRGIIPPHATLIYEIELIKIVEGVEDDINGKRFRLN
jgi:FKBP-type peptidyl-prolyl cis-trans isomerase FklB